MAPIVVRFSCPRVPAAPLDVDVNANIRIADARNSKWMYGPAATLTRSFWFYNQVKTGGPWDYKQQNPRGMYTDFGNFNFGATGRAVGFSPAELVWGAGIAQLFSDLSDRQWPNGLGTRFDNPDDTQPILDGIRYYENGCYF